jgi:hypothetical protein
LGSIFIIVYFFTLYHSNLFTFLNFFVQYINLCITPSSLCTCHRFCAPIWFFFMFIFLLNLYPHCASIWCF